MIFKFNQRLFGVESVRLSGYTEDGQHIIMPLELVDDEWVCDVKVTDNTFRYRFLINGSNIRFNDPNASYYMIDCFGDVWSIYNKLTKPYDDPIKIDKIVIADRVMKDINKIRPKKTLNMREDIKVAAGLKMSGICGIHSVTIMWHQPDGNLFRMEERSLDVPLENGFVNADVWFWLNFGNMNPKYSKGIWELEVYVDGKSVIRDNFIIGERVREEYVGFLAVI